MKANVSGERLFAKNPSPDPSPRTPILWIFSQAETEVGGLDVVSESEPHRSRKEKGNHTNEKGSL